MSELRFLSRLLREKGLLGFVRELGAGARKYSLAWRFVTREAPTLDWRSGLERVLESRRPEHGILAMQKDGEIRELLAELVAVRPRRVLEIGTASGGTLFLWTRVAARDATIISVDLPEGPWGGGYRAWRKPLYKRFARRGQEVVLIRGNSKEERVQRSVSASLGDEPLDFLFIDGDHSYEGVRSDFEAFAPRVREGGLIALHDICPDPARPEIGVARFWRELFEGCAGRELIEHSDQPSYGIGLVVASAAATPGTCGPRA